ncbi:MAG: multidrug efflux system outer membrane protein [Sphingobacteriales bacterium]|jgi:multidrug efflux system outer membrane protein
MLNKSKNIFIGFAIIMMAISGCTPKINQKSTNLPVPEKYNTSLDSNNLAKISWQEYFSDPFLKVLIDSALNNNQELNITLEELYIAKNEVRARKGEYLPFLGIQAGSETEKVGRYTSKGANDANTEIKLGLETPDPLPDFRLNAYSTWELDVWRKLRNAKKAALTRYLSSIEGKNFMVTNLIAEVANSYFELLALDNELEIVNQNIQIQNNALKIVKLQKEATHVTELAVKRFEAQVLNTTNLQYAIKQEITEAENRINFLLGRFPQQVLRNSGSFVSLIPNMVYSGIPIHLLENRTDVRQAELDLVAAKLDIKVAKASFYPSLGISAGIGLHAFSPSLLLMTPQSLEYKLAGDLIAPLINRSAIKAIYLNANAKQIQAVYNYEQTVLRAYMEVVNQLAKVNNLESSYNLKAQEVQALNKSVDISNSLFRSARADYIEVLLTQREALEAKFELVETKKQQMNAMVDIYQALGGGWD